MTIKVGNSNQSLPPSACFVNIFYNFNYKLANRKVTIKSSNKKNIRPANYFLFLIVVTIAYPEDLDNHIMFPIHM